MWMGKNLLSMLTLEDGAFKFFKCTFLGFKQCNSTFILCFFKKIVINSLTIFVNWNFQEILTKDPSSAWGCDTSGNLQMYQVSVLCLWAAQTWHLLLAGYFLLPCSLPTVFSNMFPHITRKSPRGVLMRHMRGMGWCCWACCVCVCICVCLHLICNPVFCHL